VTLTVRVDDITLAMNAPAECPADTFANNFPEFMVDFVRSVDKLQLPTAEDKGFYIGSSQGLLMREVKIVEAKVRKKGVTETVIKQLGMDRTMDARATERTKQHVECVRKESRLRLMESNAASWTSEASNNCVRRKERWFRTAILCLSSSVCTRKSSRNGLKLCLRS
jgi:hypothetical protein